MFFTLKIEKHIPWEELLKRRENLKQSGKQLVLTNGCFDLLHPGHVHFLEAAAQQGDELWVGVNSDASVRALKGAKRPIYPQEARLYLLSALQCVDQVFLFDTPHLAREMASLQADIYVKAGDYTLESLNPLERFALEQNHTRILFLDFVIGWSTTKIIQKIQNEILEK